MKAIFTGTEQDLIEAGFIKVDYDILFNKNLDNPFYVRTQDVGKNKKHYYQVSILDNVIDIKESFTFYFEKLAVNKNKNLIQDLIDKNLVRFEKE